MDKDWNIVQSKSRIVKKYIWRQVVWVNVYYIWKTKSTWKRIVYYEWKILSHNKTTWICKCSMLDRNIEINPEQLYVDMDIPLKVLVEK